MEKPISYRTETDSMGQMQVPSTAYYGAQTARAIEQLADQLIQERSERTAGSEDGPIAQVA